jgi:hypothetical protein
MTCDCTTRINEVLKPPTLLASFCPFCGDKLCADASLRGAAE